MSTPSSILARAVSLAALSAISCTPQIPLAPPVDAASADTISADVPASDVSAEDAPRSDAPAIDVPRSDAPAIDVPTSDAPAIDVPTSDAPTSDAPTSDAPTSDAPAIDAPAIDVPAIDVPASDAPAIDVVAPCTGGTVRCGGACVDTGTSLAHCGACDHACALANATSACRAGMCRVATCASGAVDCDGDAANGCEAVTATDARNCGGCGIACGGAAVCRDGACVCTGVTCGGRCVDTAVDPFNCGTCGYACPTKVACARGHCGTLPCAPGLLDCAGRCVDPSTDGANCGACGRVCGVGEACTRGRCASAPWSRALGGGGDDEALAVVRDGVGNLYAGGTFSSTITLGATRLTGPNHGWLAKLSPTGEVLWAITAGAAVRGLAVDPSNNLYVVGTFTGSAMIGPRTISSAGATDWFAASFQPDGAVRWATRQGGAGDEYAAQVSADGMGNVWVAGFFPGTTVIDGRSLVSRGGNDVFVARLSTSAGALLDAHAYGSTSYDSLGGITAVPGDGYAISMGFGAQLFVGSTTIAGAAVEGVVLRFSQTLALQWSANLHGRSNVNVNALARDDAGNLYAAGRCAVGPLTVGTGSLTTGAFDGFVVSVSPSGAYRWGVSVGGAGTDSDDVDALSVAPDGAVFALGWSQSPDLAIGGTRVAVAGGRVSWLAAMSPSGSVTAARALSSGITVREEHLSVGAADVFVGGSFFGTGTFEGQGLTASSGVDAFLSRSPR